MIAQIKYGDSVTGMIQYVTKKKKSEILSFRNVNGYSNDHLSLFSNIISFQGNRSTSSSRFVHITLNLDPKDTLSNSKFTKLSDEYMAHMGYKDQPYMVVKHNDRKHAHVHIITTKVKEDLNVINSRNDRYRSQAISRSLEKKFNLKRVPSKKVDKNNASKYSIDAITDRGGVRFYIQDHLERLLRKHKFRSLKELFKELKTYHINGIETTSENGLKGVAFGLDSPKEDTQLTRLIAGSKIHKKYSYQQLAKLFENNNNAKFVLQQKKRLFKQIDTALSMFESVSIEDLPEVLKISSGIRAEFHTSATGAITGYKVYDKTGYIFNASEIHRELSISNSKQLTTKNNKSVLNINSKSTTSFIQKIVKEAYAELFKNNIHRFVFESDLLASLEYKDILPYFKNNSKYGLLLSHLKSQDKIVTKRIFESKIEQLKSEIPSIETKEKITLLDKTHLADSVYSSLLEHNTHLNTKGTTVLNSLGLVYKNNTIQHLDSVKYQTKAVFQNISSAPSKVYDPNPSGARYQNYLILNSLFGENSSKDLKKTTQSSFFLPMYYPEIYDNLPEKKSRLYSSSSINKYLEHSILQQKQSEKDPTDFIEFLNAKGFYFEKTNNNIVVGHILQPNGKSHLNKEISSYLLADPLLNSNLEHQQHPKAFYIQSRHDSYNSLWVTNLIEQKLYDKAAFLMVHNRVKPLLHPTLYASHLENGLEAAVKEMKIKKLQSQVKRFLQKSAYLFSSLASRREDKPKDYYNGFKDELTDFKANKVNNPLNL